MATEKTGTARYLHLPIYSAQSVEKNKACEPLYLEVKFYFYSQNYVNKQKQRNKAKVYIKLT